MESTKQEAAANSRPVMSYAVGEIKVAIFENVINTKNNGAFKAKSISISRRYRNPNGEWKTSKSIPIGSAHKLAAILNKIEQEQVDVNKMSGGGSNE